MVGLRGVDLLSVPRFGLADPYGAPVSPVQTIAQ